jgi:hypothetical protein
VDNLGDNPIGESMPDQKPSQLVNVLSLLKEREAVCGTELLGNYIPRYASVIHRLRKRDYLIETRPCSRVGHTHESPQIEYRLAAVPNTDEEYHDITGPEAMQPTEDGRLFDP